MTMMMMMMNNQRPKGAGGMSFLSMVEAKLPPGFRFHPKDDELICDYLAAKVVADGKFGSNNIYGCPTMVDVDLNKCEPWDLPETACVVGGKEWYFFSLRDRKYATGQRTNRATMSGYWKATGKDRPVSRNAMLVGMRKTLVFYQGRAPKGNKTEWVMHEFRLEAPRSHKPKLHFKEDWVLCRVFYKSRGGVSTKPSTEETTSYDDSVSHSLPPLMDNNNNINNNNCISNNFITFDQTSPNMEGFEQVPCFSSLNPTQTPNQALNLPCMDRALPFITKSGLSQFGAIPDLSSGLNQLSCDKQVLKTVLNHLTKMEASAQGEVTSNLSEGSLVGYLTHTGSHLPWSAF